MDYVFLTSEGSGAVWRKDGIWSTFSAVARRRCAGGQCVHLELSYLEPQISAVLGTVPNWLAYLRVTNDITFDRDGKYRFQGSDHASRLFRFAVTMLARCFFWASPSSSIVLSSELVSSHLRSIATCTGKNRVQRGEADNPAQPNIPMHTKFVWFTEVWEPDPDGTLVNSYQAHKGGFTTVGELGLDDDLAERETMRMFDR